MKPRAHVVGLTGPIASGKDTVADLLVTHCGAHKVAFATALRSEVTNAFCVDLETLTRRETKEHPITALALSRSLNFSFVGHVIKAHEKHRAEGAAALDIDAPRSARQIMQWWGTEYRRATEPGYWVRQALNQILWLQKNVGARLVVVSDVRFADEAEMIRKLGGQIWQIKRPGTDTAADAHSSELTNGGADFSPDQVINNQHDMRLLQQLTLGAWASLDWKLDGVRVELPA